MSRTPSTKKAFPTFLNPFDEHDFEDGTKPYTLIELNMMNVINAIKSKPHWYEKIRDEVIANKWKEETRVQNLLGHESQLQYIFDELIYSSQTSNKQISSSAVDGVWVSDEIINEALRQRFAELVAPIEATCTDYHPDSNEQMLDLVHPHLYPYVRDLTRTITDTSLPWYETIGSGKVNSLKKSSSGSRSGSSDMYSDNYQWLPTDVQVDENGKCTFLSYINNLHPRKHAELYHVLEQILERFLPLFNSVLTDLANTPQSGDSSRRRHNPDMWRLRKYWTRPSTGPASAAGGAGGADTAGGTSGTITHAADGSEEEDAEEEDGDGEWDEEYEENKVLKSSFQIIPPFEPPAPPDQVVDLKGSRLQVIVKLANIILTPEKPTFNGGTWHIEGK